VEGKENTAKTDRPNTAREGAIRGKKNAESNIDIKKETDKSVT
jgi:hypothetical protein